MSTHTPGPWQRDATIIWSSSTHRLVAALCEPKPKTRVVKYATPDLATEHWDEMMANARLITSAPDLAARLSAAEQRAAELEAALIPLLDEFGARLSDGKPLGYTVGAMDRALRMIHTASAALSAPTAGTGGDDVVTGSDPPAR